MMKTGKQPRIPWMLPGAAVTLLLLSFALVFGRYSPAFNAPNKMSETNAPSPENSLAFYQWSYLSEGQYFAADGQAMKVVCKAQGNWQVKAQDSHLVIESFRCNDQNLTPKEEYRFKAAELLALDPKTVSAASPINALALALAREVNLGVGEFPEQEDRWSYSEERLEGSLVRIVRLPVRGRSLEWTKNYQGFVPSRPEMQHKISSESSGRSRASKGLSPFEALEVLHMKETESVSRGRTKVSSVNVSIEIKRSSSDRKALSLNSTPLPIAVTVSNPEISRREVLDLWNNFLAHPGHEKAVNDPLYVRLKLAFRHDPKFTEEFRHKLENYAPDSEEFKLLLGALAYAGSEEASNILVESAEAKAVDPVWQRAIAPVLGLATKPTDASWNYLDKLRRLSKDPEIQKVSELAMASEYGKGFRSKASEDFVASVRSLDTNVRENITSILDLVGNAALEDELPRLSEWAKSPDTDLRSAVAESLRLMKSRGSEELLLQLLEDAAIEVKRSAAHAFETRTLSLEALPMILSALGKSKDELLFVSLLETLYAARSLDPELWSKLKAMHGSARFSPALEQRWTELESSLETN